MPEGDARLEKMAQELRDSGQYVVLRSMGEFREREVPEGATVERAAIVDVETTGFSPARDAVIEVAVVPFDYVRETGEIIRAHEPFTALNDPGRPIPREIVDLTGITDDDVRGKRIDRERLHGAVEPARLLIAHNAGFDRPFLERLAPVFAGKPWACSISDVNWAAEGRNANKLEYLAMASGFFYEAHRAGDDCLAVLTILAELLPRSGRPAMAELLDNARGATLRFEATGAPFETKDILKARGYRWNPQARVWWKDVHESAGAEETAWLQDRVYPGRAVPKPVRFTALERYSGRNPA